MKLDIRKPCYYSKTNEIEAEIIEMCEKITIYFNNREYSRLINRFDVLPVVAPANILAQGLWEEETMFTKSVGVISIFKHVDYEKYIHGTVEDKKKLTVKCIIEASKMIKKKRETQFDAKQFEKDLLEFLNYSKKEIEQI